MGLSDEVTFEVRDRVAIITLNRPKQLNAMTQEHYFKIATHLREVAKMDEVAVTLLIGRGRFFSSSVFPCALLLSRVQLPSRRGVASYSFLYEFRT